MEKGTFLGNSQIIILGICIAVATIAASVILSQGALRIMKFQKENITVTGSAQQQIKSDQVVWQCSFSRFEADLPTAYKKLNDDLVRVKAYLTGHGIKETEMAASQIGTTMIYEKNKDGKDTNKVEGYRLMQAIEIRSGAVDQMTEVSRASTELIDQNIEFVSYAPQYFYTDLDELKVTMLAKATENAKRRAESMAKPTGNRVGMIRSAKMGVFQITPLTSTDVSDWGENDTTSIDKKVMSVVTVSFAIE